MQTKHPVKTLSIASYNEPVDTALQAGEAILKDARHRLTANIVIMIPAGTEHKVVNTSRRSRRCGSNAWRGKNSPNRMTTAHPAGRDASCRSMATRE